jgi:hypothetical protein
MMLQPSLTRLAGKRPSRESGSRFVFSYSKGVIGRMASDSCDEHELPYSASSSGSRRKPSDHERFLTKIKSSTSGPSPRAGLHRTYAYRCSYSGPRRLR